MRKINKFSIVSIKLSGFKKFVEPVEFRFGNVCYITGENGHGKSSIADAIAFAFCGTPFWGDKSSEKLISQNAAIMQVDVELADENGEIHKLTRRRTGSNTIITFDTLPVRQTDVATIFAERDIFLSIFNPLYFIEKIAEDGRTFLQKLLPPIEQEQVFQMLSENTKSLLENESLLDTEYYIKTKRENMRELDDDNIYLSGQLDLLKSQLNKNGDNLNGINNSISDIKQKISVLEDMQFKDIDVEALKKQKSDILENINSENRKELLAKQSALYASEYQSKLTADIAKITAELDGLYAQHKKLFGLLQKVKPGIKCPTCFRQITENNIQDVNTELKNQLDDIVATGKNIALQKNELVVLDEKCKSQFMKFRDEDIKKVEFELLQFGSTDISEVSLIDDMLKQGNLSDEQLCDLNCLEVELVQAESELNALSNTQDLKTDIEKLEKSVKSNETQVNIIQNLIFAAVEYAAKRAELSLKQLQMNKAAIKLIDVVKSTGEIKNIFRFTYDGKDYRWLSNSEKIKAGLEVSDLLRRLTGCNYPTFVDNAESITSLKIPEGQTLFAFVKKGNALSVTDRSEVKAVA